MVSGLVMPKDVSFETVIRLEAFLANLAFEGAFVRVGNCVCPTTRWGSESLPATLTSKQSLYVLLLCMGSPLP